MTFGSYLHPFLRLLSGSKLALKGEFDEVVIALQNIVEYEKA